MVEGQQSRFPASRMVVSCCKGEFSLEMHAIVKVGRVGMGRMSSALSLPPPRTGPWPLRGAVSHHERLLVFHSGQGPCEQFVQLHGVRQVREQQAGDSISYFFEFVDFRFVCNRVEPFLAVMVHEIL